MAAYLSQDLRIRVIRAIEGGMSRYAAAKRFGISSASAIRWMQTYLRTGAPRQNPVAATADPGVSKHTPTLSWPPSKRHPTSPWPNSEGALSASVASTSPSAPSTSSFGDTTSR